MKKLILISFLLINMDLCWAQENCFSNYSACYPICDVVDKKLCQERLDNPFLINLYEPNYIFPFYYSSSLPRDFYHELNKDTQKTEVSFQISFKAPIVKNIFNSNTNLYLAYTQKSFWQAYENSAYIRETTYTPEIFFSKFTNYPIGAGWKIKLLNFGAIHQSNGRGDLEERTWNRVYIAPILAKDNWRVAIKPWYVLNDRATQEYNPNIAYYLGYDSVLVSYKYRRHVFSAERTNLESGFKRGSIVLTWSLPITNKLKFYTEFFGGYGQSLTEYNHSVASVGVGIALNDWI
jgi:phospholipase A1/A2